MEEIFNEIRNGLDVPYMLVVNVVTYLIIKSIDSVNGDKAVPKYLKVCTAIIVGILIGVGACYRDWETDRKSTRLNSSHSAKSRMPSSA